MSEEYKSTKERKDIRSLLRTLNRMVKLTIGYHQQVEEELSNMDSQTPDRGQLTSQTDNMNLLSQGINACDGLLNELINQIDDGIVSTSAENEAEIQRITQQIEESQHLHLRAQTKTARLEAKSAEEDSVSSSHISWDQTQHPTYLLSGRQPQSQLSIVPSPVPHHDKGHEGEKPYREYSSHKEAEQYQRVRLVQNSRGNRDYVEHPRQRAYVPSDGEYQGPQNRQHGGQYRPIGELNFPQSPSARAVVTREVDVPTSVTTTYVSSTLRTSAAPFIFTANSHHTQVPTQGDQSHNDGEISRNVHQIQSVKLPQIDMPKFNGDVRKYKAFMEMHMSTIGRNVSLSPIMKLHYLNASLEGDAKKVTEFLSHVDDSYQIALNLLHENFYYPDQAKDDARNRLAKIKKPQMNAQDLRVFKIEIESNLQCLHSLGEDINHGYYIHLVFSILPPAIAEQIRRIEEDRSKWTMQQLLSQISKEIRIRRDQPTACLPTNRSDDFSSTAEALAIQARTSNRGYRSEENRQNGKAYNQSSSISSGGWSNQGFNRTRPAQYEQATTQPVSNCIFCDGRHFHAECPKFKTIAERSERIRELNLCFRCLKPNHRVRECQVPKERLRCYQCRNTGHLTAMCEARNAREYRNKAMVTNTESAVNSNEESSENENQVLTVSNEDDDGGRTRFTFLETAIHNISNESDRNPKVQARALHDTASNRSFITRDLANRLNLTLNEEKPLVVDVFGANTTQMTHSTATIKLHLDQGQTLQVKVSVVPRIMSMLKRIPLPEAVYRAIPKGDRLADPPPDANQNSTLDILIGQNAYHDIMNGSRIKVMNGPYLLSSKVGWVVAGTAANRESNRPTTAHLQAYEIDDEFIHVETQPEPLKLSTSIHDMFSLEAIGIKDDPTQKDDDTALAEFNARTIFKNNRYYVPWLWRNNACQLPTNKALARKRFEATTKKLSEAPEKFKKYDEVMKGQINLGVIEEVKETSTSNRIHYISHHAVETPQKTTTKLRVVYDASAKESKSSPSLNECLYRGPLWLENLISILLRFRMNKIGLTADIEKAYLQVGLLPEERDVTRLFWLKDIQKPPSSDNVVEYRFTRVAFGLKSSAFLLDGAIMLHMKNDKPDKDIAEDIELNHYVDNVVSGRSDLPEAKRYYDAAKAKFSRASMNLREWASNCKELLKYIPEKDRVSDDIIKVLGVRWNTEADELMISTQSEKKATSLPHKITPRTILSQISQIFDPFGLLSPITIRGRVMMQGLSRGKANWDSEVPADVRTVFTEIYADQIAAGQLAFPRYIVSLNQMKGTTLHCFCDASMKAYGTVVYAAHPSLESPRLVYAKNRVAPKSPATLTLPRLELMAVLIGVRAVRFIQRSLKVDMKAIVWSDSQIVLSWLDSERVLETFVRNRVSEINQKPSPIFRYVPTLDNPADKSSRGTRLSELDSLWWHGPNWLTRAESEWPPLLSRTAVSNQSNTEDHHEEKEICAVTNVIAKKKAYPFLDIDETRFTDPDKLIRTVAYCWRFVNRIFKRQQGKREAKISSEEFRQAQMLYLKQHQHQSFPEIYKNVGKYKKAVVGQLGVFEDENGLLRCSGRLARIKAPEGTKFPILLSTKAWFTKITCRMIHQVSGHCGTNYTIAKIRRSYWIPKGRSIVKQIIKDCVKCTKSAPRSYNLPKMPELPAERVTQSAPFFHTGLDYFGPLYIFNDKAAMSEKVWVCLFTCLATRAVHLELVKNMTTEQFQLALRRFCATYSVPQSIICDNARQFQAMANESTRMKQLEHISWHFIVDYAPWQGGVYERMVQVVKGSLKKALGSAKVSWEELATILKEVQDIVNDRPITSISDDPTDFQALTPKKFIYPYHARPAGGLVEHEIDHDPRNATSENLLVLWNRGKNLLQEFWKQWSTEYLLSLRESARWFHKSGRRGLEDVPKVNEVVLLKQASMPVKVKWNIARIEELIQSKDGMCRAVKVRMPNGHILTRPVNYIAPLEFPRNTTEGKPRDESASTEHQCGQSVRVQPTRKCKSPAKQV